MSCSRRIIKDAYITDYSNKPAKNQLAIDSTGLKIYSAG
ncbi:hypothetical protein BTN50_1192 [Candidatus Enterovibrio altilux]|uniref:Uncharacterized protein n=1 Tax=Candidatus Enterovibrio altilux TaxID=1927128 RepID=A0A291B9K5_9GAMM|nr:hypothetical protein BTN50_1192 [Candidatus Enterovibrio luxaltus]